MEEKKETEVLDIKSAILTICVLYKANLLTRNHLKHIVKLLQELKPEEITVKYLVAEAAKAS